MCVWKGVVGFKLQALRILEFFADAPGMISCGLEKGGMGCDGYGWEDTRRAWNVSDERVAPAASPPVDMRRGIKSVRWDR